MTGKPHWSRVRFGDVVRLSKGRSADPEAEGIERYVGIEHIEPEDLRIRSWGSVAEGTTFANRFKPGQVLFVKRRAYQRKVAVADFEGVCSGDIYVLEPRDDRLLPELLPFICQTDAFFAHAVNTSAGSLSPRTNWTQLGQYALAMPPLAEQRRIAELLDGAEQALEAAVRLDSRAETLQRAYIKEAFTEIVHGLGTSTVKVADAGEVLMGRQRSPRYERGISPRPYLRVANVFDGYIDTTDVKTMDFSDDEFERYHLVRGDVLLNEGQSRELVGRSSIFRDEVSDCCFQNTLIRFRPTNVSSEYAQHYFRFCLYTGRFVSVAKQTTSIAHLGAKRFGSMSFPLVTAEIEQRVVETLAHVEQGLRNAAERKKSCRQLKHGILNALLA